MGIEYRHADEKTYGGDEYEEQLPCSPFPPLVLGLQPSALIDHVAKVDSYLLSKIPGEIGGSFPVEVEELEQILTEVNIHALSSSPSDQSLSKTMAGGSVANSIRGLAAGFGISTGIIGTCGDDELGKLFQSNMSSYGVNISRLRKQHGTTAQCVCLVDELGNRTMRPCLSKAAKIQADELSRDDFKGSRWLVIRYAIANLDIIHSAIQIAKQEGLFISLDLASFEMVRKFRAPLLQLLESGNIDLCFANEDEAMELLRGEQNSNPEAALEFLSNYCKWAVVTLGANGCSAKHGKEIVKVPAIGETKARDATGAGDLFACGFLYGMVKGLSLEECCRVGTCSGASVIRSLGGEVTPENWQWMHKQLETKVVVSVELLCSKCRLKVMKLISTVEGISSIALDPSKSTATVIGEADPVCIIKKVRKFRKTAQLISIGPAKEEKKDEKKEASNSNSLARTCQKCDVWYYPIPMIPIHPDSNNHCSVL